MRRKRTLWQRAVLAIMYSVENHAKAGGSTRTDIARIQFGRGALERLLQFDWQGYHTRAMVELEDSGWIVIRLADGKVVGYTLTNAAAASLWQDYCLGVRCTLVLNDEEEVIPF